MCVHTRTVLACTLEYILKFSKISKGHATGEGRSKGLFAHADYCNFVNFNFSTWFYAQIVENRETQLSSPFLGPGDNFSKSYDENQICMAAVCPRCAGAWGPMRVRVPPWARAARTYPPNLVFVIAFRKIVPRTKKWARKTRLTILYNLR
jgi:hypothetical protein